MESAELVKLLWDLANGITAFAVVQGLVFAYACAKKETADVFNTKALKATIACLILFIGASQMIAIWWSKTESCGLDADHCELYSQATTGRLICVAGLLAFSIAMLYARQLFARRPFDSPHAIYERRRIR